MARQVCEQEGDRAFFFYYKTMVMTQKAWQDHLLNSFGQESEPARTEADGLTVGGVYNETPPTIATGEFSRLQVDANGNLMTNLVSSESITIGTLNTIGTVTRIGNIGTIESGTVTTSLALNTGTITTIAAGTQNTLGTVGVVNNVVTGTLAALAAGTITGGTLQNLVSGTVNALASGTITGGTLGNLVSGTINALASGTITGGTLQNLVSGTVNALASGTITGGTLQNLNSGTVSINQVPVVIGTPYVVVGTAGAGLWGTIIAAAGAGTRQYVSGVDIVGVSGSVEVAVTNIGIGGSVGAGVLARGWILPGGGIAKNFLPVQASGTNGTLSYWMGGAGTVDIAIQYWQGV